MISSKRLQMNFSFFRRLLCLACFLPVLASAQSKGPRTCRILFLGAPDSAPETLQLFDGKACQPVELPRMNFSPVYHLPAGDLLIRMLTSIPAKPEDVSPEAPKAAVAEAISDFYLILSSDPANKVAPVRMQIIDADASKFKAGQMLWFNLTSNSIGGQIGTETLAMKANSQVVLNAPASGSSDYNVNLSFRIPGSDLIYPLCETKWQYDPRSRTVQFVVVQEGSRTPRVMGFPDYRDPEKKAGQP